MKFAGHFCDSKFTASVSDFSGGDLLREFRVACVGLDSFELLVDGLLALQYRECTSCQLIKAKICDAIAKD